MTDQEHKDEIERMGFEHAMLRVRMRNEKNGVTMPFQQLLQEAETEHQRSKARLAQKIAALPPE